MAKKYKELKQIFPRDKEFFGHVHNTGVIRPEDLQKGDDNKTNCGITLSRMKAYIDAGYMEKTKPENGGKFGYVQTGRGKDFAEKTWGYERSDAYTFQSLEHCGKLTDEYFKTDLEKYEWRTESQAREMFQERIDKIAETDPDRAQAIQDAWDNKEISMPDAIVVERGTERVIAVEVITNSYGQEELAQKEMFVEVMQVEYKPIRA